MVNSMTPISWLMHRLAVDRLKIDKPFMGSVPRALFLSVIDEISLTQIFPFFIYAPDLRIEARELPIARYRAGHNPYISQGVDIVFLQTWFDLTDDAMNTLLDSIAKDWPAAKIVYLDWFAPADLRYAKVLNDRVAVYVKKQALRDFSQYNQPTQGHTNLSDYYSKRFGLHLPVTTFEVPQTFKDKLVFGAGFENSPRILSMLRSKPRQRSIDLHARVQANGTDWYTAMRDEAHRAAMSLRGNVARNGRVSHRAYRRELLSSRMCFSPFGYGEVCWRDYEAMAAGAVVLKPNMDHLQLADDVFTKQTYLPLRWDLSDLVDVVEASMEDGKLLDRLSANARDMLVCAVERESVVTKLQRTMPSL